MQQTDPLPRLCENAKRMCGNLQVRKGGLPPLERQRRECVGYYLGEASLQREMLSSGNTFKLGR
jgi:hypothetical protein